MKLITTTVTLEELKVMTATFGNFVKAVVDIDKVIVAVDAELHSDLEAFLLAQGSTQKDLWGINLYPELQGQEFVEYDSMINVRPSQGNYTRGVEKQDVRDKIIAVVAQRIKQ